MTESSRKRPGKGAIVIGVILLLVSSFSLVLTKAFVADAARNPGFGEPADGGAAQWVFTSAWLVATGIILLRGSRPGLFGICAGLALSAALFGLLNWVPLSFGNPNQDIIDAKWDPLGFVAWALSAGLAGIGHIQQVRASKTAAAWHLGAVALAIVGVAYVVSRHA